MIMLACLMIALAAAQNGSHAGRPDSTVQVQMHNVLYHFTDDIAVHIEDLRGALVPTRNNSIPVFDDKDSFVLRITDAEIAISATAMSNVLNSYILVRPDSPLKNISIRVEKSELKIKGKLHSKGNIPFEMDASASVTPEGNIRLSAKSIKALHLPVKGLMDLLGTSLASLIKAGKLTGMKAEKDDLILDPQQILPPPHIEGRVTGIRLDGNDIVQSFGHPEKLKTHRGRQNYMRYEGNRLRFGKLTMSDTDLTLLDMSPNDPFDFYLEHYKDQLVAGYSKTTPSFGLRVYMRDFNKLGQSGPPAKPRQH
jgi:hypothetical protein